MIRTPCTIFALILVGNFLVGCDQSTKSKDFDYVGKLSVTMPSTGGTLLQLSVDGADYEMNLKDDTEYTNIRVTPVGTVWQPGEFYGVSGELRGNRLIVDSISFVFSLDGIPVIGDTDEEAFDAWLEKKCAQLEADGLKDEAEWDCD